MEDCPLCDNAPLLFVCKKCITVYGVFDKYENEIELNGTYFKPGTELFINDKPCTMLFVDGSVIVKLKTTLRNIR
jgi:prepilin-type processing-associated H-X9-DG protein